MARPTVVRTMTQTIYPRRRVRFQDGAYPSGTDYGVASHTTTGQGGGNLCAMYYPFDVDDPRMVIEGCFVALRNGPNLWTGTTTLRCLVAFVEADGSGAPGVEQLNTPQEFDVLTCAVSDPTLAPVGGTEGRAVKFNFTNPIRPGGPPRRIYLCIVWEPNWDTGTTTKNRSVGGFIVAGSAVYLLDMATTDWNDAEIPTSVAGISAVSGGIFLGFRPGYFLRTTE